jgi:hypothetical protein
LLAIEQSKTIDEPDQTKVMIAVQMRDKDMRDTAVFYIVSHELKLRAFATIYQKFLTVDIDELTGRKSLIGGYGRVVS